MKNALLALTALPLIAACADSGASYRPILDGPAAPAFQADRAACQTLARTQSQLDQETLGAAVLGAGSGALLGEVDDEGDALGGAIVGALAGGAASAINGNERREAIVIECLRARSHRVVG